MRLQGTVLGIFLLFDTLVLLAIHRVGAQSNPSCSDGAVRLISGNRSDLLAGRLEVCLGGVWGSVCNDGWDLEDAVVVCRQLGVTSDDMLNDVIFGTSYGGGPVNQPIHFESPMCIGSESRLIDCQYDPNHDCAKAEDVGIICKRANDCTDGGVRLVDGERPTEGRVEFCVGGRWGTVCGSTPYSLSWDAIDVVVVCRQLGNFTLDPQVLSPVPSVTDQSTPINIGELHCTGRENRLDGCWRSPVVEYCSHDDDAGANCTREFECSDNDVRLVGGSSESEGTVEFCRDGYWGEVCRTGWDNDDATVVCRQLGFDVEGGSAVSSFFGTGSNFRRIWLNRVGCSRNETSLDQCSHDESNICFLPSAGVVCPSSSSDVTEPVTTEQPPAKQTNPPATDLEHTGPPSESTDLEHSGPPSTHIEHTGPPSTEQTRLPSTTDAPSTELHSKALPAGCISGITLVAGAIPFFLLLWAML